MADTNEMDQLKPLYPKSITSEKSFNTKTNKSLRSQSKILRAVSYQRKLKIVR